MWHNFWLKKDINQKEFYLNSVTFSQLIIFKQLLWRTLMLKVEMVINSC